jgi:hypothetical protein
VYRYKYAGKGSKLNFYEITLGTAGFYYGVFLLNTQSFEFRYFFPAWLLMYAVLVAVSAEVVLQKERYRRVSVTGILLMWAAGFCGGYLQYVSAGDAGVAEICTCGRPIYEDAERSLFFYQDCLYIITEAGADNEYPFFLEYKAEAGEGSDESFYFRDCELPTAFWKKKIALVELAHQGWDEISVGQCYDNHRFWEYSAAIESITGCPAQLAVFDYSDPDWERGYHLTVNGFLVEGTGMQYERLIGKGLTADGENVMCYVTDVGEMNGYTMIYTDVLLEDHNIREYRVINQ